MSWPVRFVMCCVPFVAVCAGCDGDPTARQPATWPGAEQERAELDDLMKRYANPLTGIPKIERRDLPARTPARPESSLPIDGLWMPGGWMGDAASSGALTYRVCEDRPYSAPTCDEWKYDPDSGEKGWVAVAYQGPSGQNFGHERGPNLSGRGFDRLTFAARSQHPGALLLVKSGGHTAPNAAFPASYEATCGVITLTDQWSTHTIMLPAPGQPTPAGDLSNVPTALAFVINRQMCPRGCVIYLDDITFRGPQ